MKSIPDGFIEFPVPDRFVQLSGPLLIRPEPDGMRAGLMLDERHGNPMGIAHGGLLVTVADMVMGVGSGFATGIRWPHPTITLNCDFVRGAKLGHWLEGKAIVSRRTINFCFCRTELICDGEVVLNASGVFRVPDLERSPEQFRPPKATSPRE